MKRVTKWFKVAYDSVRIVLALLVWTPFALTMATCFFVLYGLFYSRKYKWEVREVNGTFYASLFPKEPNEKPLITPIPFKLD